MKEKPSPLWTRLAPARDAASVKIPKPPAGGWRWGDTEHLYRCAAAILDAHAFPPTDVRFEVGWRWEDESLFWTVVYPHQSGGKWLSEESALNGGLADKLWPSESPLRWAMAVRGAFDLHMAENPRSDLIPDDDPAHAYRIGFELAAFLAAYDTRRQVWPWASKARRSRQLRRQAAKEVAAKKAEHGWQPKAYTLALEKRAEKPNMTSEELINEITNANLGVSDRRTVQRALTHWTKNCWPAAWPGRFER